MIEDIGPDAAEPAELVDHPLVMGEQVAQLHPAVAVAGEFPPGTQQLGIGFEEGEPPALGQAVGRRLPVVLTQRGLVAKQLELTGPASHEQVNDIPDPGRSMRRPRLSRGIATRSRCRGCLNPPGKLGQGQRSQGEWTQGERAQRQRAQPSGGVAQALSAG